MGHLSYARFGYADDVNLLAPSVGALQDLITICENFAIEYHVIFNEKRKFLYAYRGGGGGGGGNFITHDLSDLNEITYKKGVFISQVNRLNARFPFVSSGVKGHLLQTYWCSFYGCQTWDLYGKHVNQLDVEWNKAVQRTSNLPYKPHRRLLPLIVNGKSFKSQHCSRLHKYVNGFFSSENIYVSFIGAKAKTRVTGSLGRNWARLAVMDGLVTFDPPDEHTSAHAEMIKNYSICETALMNVCILAEQRLTISFIIYAVNDKSYLLLLLFL